MNSARDSEREMENNRKKGKTVDFMKYVRTPFEVYYYNLVLIKKKMFLFLKIFCRKFYL